MQSIENFSLLDCPSCWNSIKDPRLLPCGESLCSECIINNCGYFDCFLCKSKHKIPQGGFPLNKSLNSFIKKPSDILKESLDDLSLKSNIFEERLQKSEAKLKKYFKSIRDQIKLAAETNISLVDKHTNQLKETFAKFRFDSIENLEKNQNFINDIHKLIQNEKCLYIKCKAYLNEHEIDENVVETELNKAKLRLNYLKKQGEEFDKILWNEKIEFQNKTENINSCYLIGQLDYKSLVFGMPNPEKARKVNLEPILNSPSITSNIIIEKMESGMFFLIFIDFRKYLNLSTFSQELVPIQHVNFKLYKSFNDFKIAQYKKKIFVYLRSKDQSSMYCSLKSYSDDLNFLKENSMGAIVTSMQADKDNLFLLVWNGILVYNHDLVFCKHIYFNETNPLVDEFYIPDTVNKFLVRDEKFYIHEGNYFKILNIQNGKEIFKTKFSHFDFYLTNNGETRIVFYDSLSKQLVYNDLKVNLICKLDLDQVLDDKNLKLIFYGFGTAIFFDHISKKLCLI